MLYDFRCMLCCHLEVNSHACVVVFANLSVFNALVSVNASAGILILPTDSGSHCFQNWTLPPFVSNNTFYLHSFLLSVIHSDISGGYSPSIFNAMRVAIHASKALSLTVNETDYRPLTHHEAFYLATMGGAQGQSSHIRVWRCIDDKAHVTPIVKAESQSVPCRHTTVQLARLLCFCLDSRDSRF